MARLPRLRRTESLVEPSRLHPRSWVPTMTFQRWWQLVVEAVEAVEESSFEAPAVNTLAVAHQVAEEMQLAQPPQAMAAARGAEIDLSAFAQPPVIIQPADDMPNPFAGWLANTGRARSKVRAVTAATTINFADSVILVDASGGAVTVSLPTAASARGFVFHVKKTDASGNAVTIDGDGAETIDDSATQATTTQYVTLTVISDGAEWWLL